MTLDSDSDSDSDDALLAAYMRAAVYAASFRGIDGVDRDVRKMPPGAVIEGGVADMAQIAVAGRQLIEAREAVATAKAALGRAALDAHYNGCPLLTMAEMSRVDRHTISRCAWAYFDTPESLHGEGGRRCLRAYNSRTQKVSAQTSRPPDLPTTTWINKPTTEEAAH